MSYYEDYQRAREALTYIDPNLPRGDWIKVGTGLKNAFGEDGKELFQEFSQRGDSYQERGFEHTWKSLDASKASMGSVYQLAKQGGYQFSEHQTQTPYSSEEKAARDAERAKREAEARSQKEQADKENLQKAQYFYEKNPAADGSHPYLQKKGIEKPEGLKHYKAENTHILFIPVFDKNEQLQGVQRIFNDGNKGIVGKVAGGSFTIGDINQATTKGVILAEGYATAYALHKQTDMPVVVGFNSHNIVTVARDLKEKLPEGTKLLVAADNDVHLKVNEGVKGANLAAMAYGDNATVVLPPEYPAHIWQEATKDGKTPTDFDDAQRWLGGEAVKKYLDEAREKMGLTSPINEQAQPEKPTSRTYDEEMAEAIRIEKELRQERAEFNQAQKNEQQPEIHSYSAVENSIESNAQQETKTHQTEITDTPPQMSEEEWAAQMAAYSEHSNEQESYDRHQTNTENHQDKEVAEPTLPLPTAETSHQQSLTEATQTNFRLPEQENQEPLKEPRNFSSVNPQNNPMETTEKETSPITTYTDTKQLEPTHKEPEPKEKTFQIPEHISQQYATQGSNERKLLDKSSQKMAIDASSDNILKTRNNDAKTIKNMLEIAQSNGWSSIKLKGSHEFKREAWLQASLQGLEVKGYKPTEQDKKLLETRQSHLEKSTNSITNDITTTQKSEREKPIHEATGKLVGYGVAVYPNSSNGSKTYYADIQDDKGNTQRLWGKGIQEALINSNARQGDNLHLVRTGNNGKQNTWKADILKTVSQQKIDLARSSGDPNKLKTAQQEFAKSHLEKREAQVQSHERSKSVKIHQEPKKTTIKDRELTR